MDDRGHGGAHGRGALGLESPTPHTGRADACVFRVAALPVRRSKPTKPQPSRPTAAGWLFVGHDATGKQLLYTLALDVATPAQPLANTDGASLPFWSPDSQSVGFFGQGKLKTVDVETGQIRTLADAGGARGGTWNRDDVILFAPRPGTGLYRISAAGGQPTPVKIDDWTVVPVVPFIPPGRPAFPVLHSGAQPARERWRVCRLARFEYGEATGHRSITCGSCNARISPLLAGRGAAGASVR